MRPKISMTAIADQAEACVRRAGSREPEEICRALDIQVYYSDLKQKLKAYYFYQSRISSIVVDENADRTYRRILLAHELGHYALHRETAMMRGFEELEILEKRDSEPMETEANLFAAELLIEDSAVLPLLNEYTFFETASLLQVPAALLDFKFAMLTHCKGVQLSALGLAQGDFLKRADGVYPQTEKDGT